MNICLFVLFFRLFFPEERERETWRDGKKKRFLIVCVCVNVDSNYFLLCPCLIFLLIVIDFDYFGRDFFFYQFFIGVCVCG